MSGKRDSFLSLPTKKLKKILGFGLDDDELQSKVLEATSRNKAINDLPSFSQVVRLTGPGLDKTLKTLKAIHRVIISDEWYVAFKGLQLLNYLLHYGGEAVFRWVLEHLRSLEEHARNLDDYHHKRVLQEQLRTIRVLVEDNWQLEKEREDTSHNGWLDKVTRPPPARLGPGYKAVGFPTADRGGNLRTRRKDLPVTRLDLTADRSGETHRKMAAKLTLQAIHMLLVCQSIIEFLQTNGDKLLFSRERDAGLWKAFLSEISKRGTYSMNLCRKELAQYFQDMERDPSEKLHRLGGSILERAIKEMRDLSLSLGSCVNSGAVCFFTDDKLGLAFYRLFSESGDERFDYVDEWEAQINGLKQETGTVFWAI